MYPFSATLNLFLPQFLFRCNMPDVIHGCPDYLGRRLVGGASVGPMGS